MRTTHEHDPRHAEWMESSLTSDHPALHPDLATCPRCREEFQELAATRLLLESVAQDDSSPAPSEEPPPGADLVEPYFRARFSERQRQPLQRGRRLALRWATAAAALLTVSWGVKQFLGHEGRAEAGNRVLLGSESSTSLWPRGAVSSFEDFRWDMKLPPGGSFDLEVMSSATREVLHKEKHLKGFAWSPPPGLAASWPDDITWSVSVLDATNSTVATPSARALRAAR